MNKFNIFILLNLFSVINSTVITIALNHNMIKIYYSKNHIKIFKLNRYKIIIYENGVFERTIEIKFSSNKCIIGLNIMDYSVHQFKPNYKFIFINLETSEIKEFKISKKQDLPDLICDWQVIANLPE